MAHVREYSPSPTDKLYGILVEAIWVELSEQWFSKACVKACAKLASCTTRESSGEKALRNRDPLLEILFQSICGGAWASPFFRSASDALIFSHHTNSEWGVFGGRE